VSTLDPELIGQHLELARKAAGLTQAALAAAARINRIQIVRMEAGLTVPRLDETVRLAEVLKVPLEYLSAGRFTPTYDLQGIALELYRLGIRDLEVSNPRVPGSFRHKEELLVLAVSGDRPEPRIVEAIPFLLLLRNFLIPLVQGYAVGFYQKEALVRLAWLSEIALALNRLSTMPRLPLGSTPTGRLSTPTHLLRLIRSAEKTRDGKRQFEPDSLGYPSTENNSPIWRRWNITYAGTMKDFLNRAIELHAAFQATRTMIGDEE
jgi:transcriptional regulator with XRE-family HTH domain